MTDNVDKEAYKEVYFLPPSSPPDDIDRDFKQEYGITATRSSKKKAKLST